MSEVSNTSRINISKKVLQVISLIAASEKDGFVKGKVRIRENNKLDLATKNPLSQRHFIIDINAVFSYGTDLKSASEKIQKAVKNSIKTMTGLEIDRVNLYISDIIYK